MDPDELEEIERKEIQKQNDQQANMNLHKLFACIISDLAWQSGGNNSSERSKELFGYLDAAKLQGR